MHHSNPSRSSFAHAAEPTAPSRQWSEYSWRLLVVYCLIVLALIGLSPITGDRFWPVQVFGYVRDFALLLALIPLPIVIWRRRKHPVVLQLLCAISLIWMPASATGVPRVAPEGSIEVSVLTLNTGNGLADPAELMSYLQQSGADIIGLQEVSPETATAIETSPETEYPYRVAFGLGIPGKALLSKYPIVDHQLLDSNPERPDLLATVAINGTLSTVIVAHPPPPHLTASGVVSRPGGDEQFAALVDTISGTNGPLLVLGDLNLTEHHDRYDHLKSLGLVDAFAESGNGPGYTYPARMSALDDVSQTLGDAPMLPLLRIDYIWGSSHWYPIETWVGDDAGSDHLPVTVRMAILPVQAATSMP